MKDLIFIISASNEGRWAAKITNELFIPLIDKSILTYDEVANVWINILYTYLGYENNNEERKSLFIIYDKELIETCAWCLSLCSDKAVEKWWKKINKVVDDDLHIVLKPFIKKIDYGLNHDILVRLMYIYSVVSLVSCYWDIYNSSLENGKRWNKLAQGIINHVMPRFKESERWQTDEGLIDYIKDINKRIYAMWLYS